MRIAIFGDSFGDDVRSWKNANRWLEVGPSWIDYLRKYHEIDNFCEGGAALYYCKKEFDKASLSKYDKIIFIVTAPTRRYNFGQSWTATRVNCELSTKKDNLSYQDKENLIALQYYFTHIYNECDLYFHDLMVKDIKNMCPHVNFLSFDLLDQAQKEEIRQITDRKISSFDLQQQGLTDARKCHLSEENNLILGKQINYFLHKNAELEIDITQFVKPSMSIDYYFRKSNDR